MFILLFGLCVGVSVCAPVRHCFFSLFYFLPVNCRRYRCRRRRRCHRHIPRGICLRLFLSLFRFVRLCNNTVVSRTATAVFCSLETDMPQPETTPKKLISERQTTNSCFDAFIRDAPVIFLLNILTKSKRSASITIASRVKCVCFE